MMLYPAYLDYEIHVRLEFLGMGMNGAELYLLSCLSLDLDGIVYGEYGGTTI